MALTFGFSKPVPNTTSIRPAKNAAVPGTASTKWPHMMMMPPMKIARLAPQSRSAIQPPGNATR